MKKLLETKGITRFIVAISMGTPILNTCTKLTSILSKRQPKAGCRLAMNCITFFYKTTGYIISGTYGHIESYETPCIVL